MMNTYYLIGRLVSDPEIIETENGRKVCDITLAVQRSFKNEEGIYETDFISTKIWAGIAEKVCDYCNKGDLIAVKGRIQIRDGKLELMTDKVSFLSSKKNMED